VLAIFSSYSVSEVTKKDREKMVKEAYRSAIESLCQEGVVFVTEAISVKECKKAARKQRKECRAFVFDETLKSEDENLLNDMKIQSVRCM